MKSKHAKPREARHIRLYHWVMQSAAWVDLDCNARAAYIEIVSRYSGADERGFSNNGRIPMSLLEMSKALHVSKQTAMRAIDALVDHGFLAVEAQGRFTTGYRRASEYRITEFPYQGEAPTKDFTRWQELKAGSTTKPSRVSIRNGTGFEMEQVPESNWPYGSITTPEADVSGSTTKPLVVYQGGAAGDEALPLRRTGGAHG